LLREACLLHEVGAQPIHRREGCVTRAAARPLAPCHGFAAGERGDADRGLC
jgi:hypothetical protein